MLPPRRSVAGGRKGRLEKGERAGGPAEPEGEEESAYVKARRRTWARLLFRVYGVDALRCSRCGGRMRVIAFISEPSVVEQILRHVGLWGAGRARGPPRGPPGRGEAMPGERRIIVDADAQEFPPDEGVAEPAYDGGA